MKDIIEKSKIKSTNLPRKLTINKVDVYNKSEIADAFNDFITNIGQKLASQIPKSSKTFETYMNKVNVIMDSKPLSINELKDAFLNDEREMQFFYILWNYCPNFWSQKRYGFCTIPHCFWVSTI